MVGWLMHFALSVRIEDVRRAAAELSGLGLEVDVHTRLPQEATQVVSVYEVRPEQRYLVARVSRQYGAEVLVGEKQPH